MAFLTLWVVGSSEASTHPSPRAPPDCAEGTRSGVQDAYNQDPRLLPGPQLCSPTIPTFTPLEGADLEGSNKEKNQTERARLGG